MKKNTLYILDTSGLIYRAYYAFAKNPLTNTHGANVSAVYGFFKDLYSLLQTFNPSFFVAALDSKMPTFRHELFDEYKATRAPTPPELSVQIPVIEEILHALNMPLLRYDGFEADDVIASLAKKCSAEKYEAVIISSDKDLMQLLNANITMLRSNYSGGWSKFNAADTFKRWGVHPHQMQDFLALVGDSSDNVPGVKGVGEKRAASLLKEFGSLEELYQNTEKLQGALKRNVIEGKESAFFSKKLIELADDIPIQLDFEHYACGNLNWPAAAQMLMREQMPSLAKLYAAQANEDIKEVPPKASARLQAVKPERETQPHPFDEFKKAPDFVPQEYGGTYKAVFTVAELNEIIDAAFAQKLVAVDCETDSTDPLTARLAGFSLSLKKGEGIYVPLIQPDTLLECLSLEAVAPALNRLFSSNITVVMHNAKFDYQVFTAHGMAKDFSCKLFDTMIAAWLLDPDRSSFSLDSLAHDILGVKTIAFKDIVPKGETFDAIPLATATDYAGEDADITLQLYEVFKPKLKEFELEKLFSDMEMPLVLLLAKMEREGIFLEKQALIDYSKELETELERCEKEIFDIVGYEFNIASPKQLQEVLFVDRKLTPGKKTKTGYSTDTGVLQDLASEDAVPGMILDYRAMAKLKSTYADALPALTDKQGRIHTSFIQTGTATGRLSSRDPNLQNIPARTKEGIRIREAFRAKPDFDLVSADYAQIELVLLAHLSQDKNLIEAFLAGVDVHKRTAALIFNTDIEHVTADMRHTAKTINFGVMYGMSAFRLANELRIPRTRAAGFIDTYFTMYSGVKEYIEQVKEAAYREGAVKTLLGRRRNIALIHSKNRNERAAAERIAVNAPIQGSAADIVKSAMLRIDAALQKEKLSSRLLLQVHDELIFEAPKAETQKLTELVKAIMENVITLSVPLRVSITSGENWGAL